MNARQAGDAVRKLRVTGCGILRGRWLVILATNAVSALRRASALARAPEWGQVIEATHQQSEADGEVDAAAPERRRVQQRQGQAQRHRQADHNPTAQAVNANGALRLGHRVEALDVAL